MLKAKENVSNENYAKLRNAIDRVAGDNSYEVAYGYAEKNVILFTLLSHYAIGFNQEEVCIVPISKDGSASSEVFRYKNSDNCKINVYGKVVLDNGSKKFKITVPGVVPSLPGTKQLQINQQEPSMKLTEIVKSFGR